MSLVESVFYEVKKPYLINDNFLSSEKKGCLLVKKTFCTNKNFLSSEKKKGFLLVINPFLPMKTFYLQRKKRFLWWKKNNFHVSGKIIFFTGKKSFFSSLKIKSFEWLDSKLVKIILFSSKKKKDFHQLKKSILPMTTFYLQRRKKLFYRLKD